jgi:hypothetical protein
MNTTYEAIERAARQLTIKQKAALAHTLLKDLDEGEDEDVRSLWLAEAKRRYDAYLRGEMESSPAEDVFARVLNRIRR